MIGNKKIKNQQSASRNGFTLIEILVSVSIFAVIILSVTSIFKLAIDGQRSAIATQNVQESLKYFLEVTAKEMRMAQKDNGVCSDIPDDEIFVVIAQTATNDVLHFKNYDGECVYYFLATDGKTQRFKIKREKGLVTKEDFISPSKIRINDLHFVLSGLAADEQHKVTLNLNANSLDSGKFDSNMTLQTSITSRYYK